jgi:hypothetical protein
MERKIQPGSTGIDIKLLAKLVAREIIEQQASKKIYITQNEAFRRYGRKNIEDWKSQGRLTGFKTGNRIQYKVKHLNSLI